MEWIIFIIVQGKKTLTSVMPVRMGSKLTVISPGQLLIVAPKLLRLVEISRRRKDQSVWGFEEGLRNNVFNMEHEAVLKTRMFSSLAGGASMGTGTCSAVGETGG